VMVLLTLVLQLMPATRAREVVAGYAARLAPGSVITVSVPRTDDQEFYERVSELWPAAVHNHAHADVAAFLGDLELLPPGVEPAAGFRPGWTDATRRPAGGAYPLAAIGRKT